MRPALTNALTNAIRSAFNYTANEAADAEHLIKKLFANGEQGVWYDPSDLSTLFQDAAGTTPVTADGDPVGLMLDKSQGLELGDNIASGVSDYYLSTAPSASIEGDYINWAGSSGREYIVGITSTDAEYSTIYEVEVEVSRYEGGGIAMRLNTGEIFNLPIAGVGVYRRRFMSGSSSFSGIYDSGSADLTFKVNYIKELHGNHATQSVSASRPTYRTDGTLHWLEFDGVDDYLSAGDVLDILDENIIMCAGYYGSRAVIAGKSVAKNEAGRYFMPFDNHTTLTHLSSEYNVAYAFPVNSPLTTTMQVLRGSTNTLSLRKNGSVVSSKAMTPDMTSYNTSRPFWIGAYPSASETILGSPMDGNLYGLVTVRKSGDLGAENLDSLEGYISDKSGVTL